MYHNLDNLNMNNHIHIRNSYKCEIKFSLEFTPINNKRKVTIPSFWDCLQSFFLVWLWNYELSHSSVCISHELPLYHYVLSEEDTIDYDFILSWLHLQRTDKDDVIYKIYTLEIPFCEHKSILNVIKKPRQQINLSNNKKNINLNMWGLRVNWRGVA